MGERHSVPHNHTVSLPSKETEVDFGPMVIMPQASNRFESAVSKLYFLAGQQQIEVSLWDNTTGDLVAKFSKPVTVG